MVFLMKMSRACTGMLSSENDFKFLKNATKHKKQMHEVGHSSKAGG